MKFPELDGARIGVVGLGYVGLPLAFELAEHFKVLGFDMDAERIRELENGVDRTLEIAPERLAKRYNLGFFSEVDALADCNVYIVTVPTPIDDYKVPDLGPLLHASRLIGAQLKPGNIVIYEPTVYPGATEDDCVPVLERESGLICNRDFIVGYSPERVNPGDQEHRIPDIVKVTSGSTPEAADFVNRLYARVIRGRHSPCPINPRRRSG